MRFIKFLEEDSNSRKIFGKKELEIIKKQVNGIPLTQSERNRLSRDIRPKLEFIEKAILFKDEFELKLNQNNKNLIKNTVNMILKDELKDDIRAILLFGSFVDKSFTKRSDIDICVIFKKDLSVKDATKFRIRVSGELSDKLDLQVFNLLPFKVKKDIARNHKVLYKSNNFDNLGFSIKYLKDEDYFIRMREMGIAT